MPKLEVVASEGQTATSFNRNASDFEKLCWAISELEKKRVNLNMCDIRKPVNANLQNRLVKLIGTKPIVKCEIEQLESDVLLDTGSQVSMCDTAWLDEHAPSAELKPVTDFLEDDEQVRFLAANNTEVPVVGAVVLNFSLGHCTFPVPFIVTSGSLSQPILGFNVMEHVIRMGSPDTVVSSLQKAMSNVSVGSLNVMVSIVSRNFEDSDCVGILKCTKTVTIPAKGVKRIKCRVKGDIKGIDLSFICSAPLNGDWDSDLEVTHSLGEIVRGRTPNVNIEIRNNASKPKEIRSNMVVGEISSVNAVIPIHLSKTSAVDVASIQEGEGNLEAPDIPENEKWQPKTDLSHLPPEERADFEKLLRDECDVFAKDDTDIGAIPELQMEINLTDEIPVNEAYRHLPRKLYDDVKSYLNDLIINGWIQESKSSYASPIVCVRKKDGSMRLCVDYRKLNLKMIPDRHPIPRVQDLLDGLGGQKYFTTLDMAKAYHQGFVKEACRKYTAFATPWALYEWLRIPFGLKNAPAAFQRYICQALMGLLDRVCLAYLDDILVYGKTLGEHKANLRKVFRRLRAKGIKLRVDKCFFAMKEVRYLGRLVSEHGYRPDPEDIKALEKFREPPKNVGEVRSMVGFLSYYRGHVENFAKKMKPVYDMIKWKDSSGLGSKGGKKGKSGGGYDKRAPIVWSDMLQAIIDDVIDTLKSPSVMAYPDFDKPFILNCDASGYGLGAVLYQQQGDDLRVISYASRTLTETENNYHLHSGKLEFLALKWSVTDKFSDYLGHGSKFTVFTDNNPLTYVMSSAKLNATGMRWVNELSEYDFTLKYRPGKSAADADGLSRNPLPVSSVTPHRAAPTTNSIVDLQRECTSIMTRDDLAQILSPPDSSHCTTANVNTIDLTSLQDSSLPPLETVSKADLSLAQSVDDMIGPVFKAVCESQRPSRREVSEMSRKSRLLFSQWRKLSIKDGVLLRKTNKFTQIVLPSKYHQTVYRELHVGMGHLASDRVEDLARQRFYWPHMPSDIDYFIRKKCSCLFTKQPNVQEKAKLVPLNATHPFEVVSVDFMEIDKHAPAGGFRYVLVVCDHFTRFSQAYATKTKSSRAAAEKIFSNFILQYGFPSRIHHDQGTEWNNKLFQHLHRLTNIKASNTTPYHPMGDPYVERYNRTLKNMLSSIPEKEKKRWRNHLPKLCFAYNSTVHKATGYTPFYLLFGRESRLRVDGAFPSFEDQVENPGRKSYAKFASEWKERMNEAFKLADQNSDKSKQYNKSKYDARVSCAKLHAGDRVLVKNVRPEGKLASFWNPDVFVVARQRGELPVFELRKYGSKSSKVRVLHRNLLKCVNELVPPDAQGSSPTKPSCHAKTPAPRELSSAVSVPPAQNRKDPSCTVPNRGVTMPSSSSSKCQPVPPQTRESITVSESADSVSDDDDEGCFIAVHHRPARGALTESDATPVHAVVEDGEFDSDEAEDTDLDTSDDVPPPLEVDHPVNDELDDDTNDLEFFHVLNDESDDVTNDLDTTDDACTTAEDGDSDDTPEISPPPTVHRPSRIRKPPEHLTYERRGVPSFRRGRR